METGAKPNLNGWVRIGIVLSVVWIIAVIVYFMKERSDTASMILGWCMEKKSFDMCWTETENVRVLGREFWINAGSAALVTTGLAWVVIGIIVWLFKWVAAGFSKA
jgi:uncharacterized membrane protein